MSEDLNKHKLINKTEVLEAFKLELQSMLNNALAEAENTNDAANHTESKAENKYDTRGLEATYISQGLAARSLKIREDLYNLSKVALSSSSSSTIGSLMKVHYTKQDKSFHYFLLPCGGLTVTHKGTPIKSLSLDSPLGKALFKRTCEDVVMFRAEEIEILSIH